MIKRKKRPILTDIEVGSFSDVAFLLIIFFILTTQIARFTGTELEIPSGQKKQEEKKNEQEQFTVNIVAGQIRVTTGSTVVPMTPEELKIKLDSQDFPGKTKDEEKQVIVMPTKDVEYELYFQVLSMIDEAGGIVVFMEEDDSDSKKKGGTSGS